MKNISGRIAKMIFASLLLTVFGASSIAQTTTIWIVRHAEKDVSNPQNPDPPLSATGEQRAKDLTSYFAKNKPDVVFSTNYKRTKATAAGFSADVKTYAPQNLNDVASGILQDHKGKNVLIVGHSNTVLETIEAFGDKRPMQSLTDEDYDYLFKVTVSADAKVKTEVLRYGAEHRNAGGGAMMKN